jgi:hypothetical protein
MTSEHCQAFKFMEQDDLFIHNLQEMGYALWCAYQLTHCMPFCWTGWFSTKKPHNKPNGRCQH